MSSPIELKNSSFDLSNPNGECEENGEEWMAIKPFPEDSAKEIINIVSLNLEFEKVIF
jgi:hypothetical protein